MCDMPITATPGTKCHSPNNFFKIALTYVPNNHQVVMPLALWSQRHRYYRIVAAGGDVDSIGFHCKSAYKQTNNKP